MKEKNALKAYPALAGAVIFWGAAFPAAGYLVNRYSIWTIMWLRMITATAAFIWIPRKELKGKYHKGDWKKLLPMIFFMPCLYFFFETSALRYTSSVQAGVISSALPLFVALGATFFLKESVGIPQISGVILSLSGVVLLTLFNEEILPGKNPLLGNSLELLAMFCAAGNMLLLKDLYRHYSPALLTLLQCLGGIIFFIPGMTGLGDILRAGLPLMDLGLILFLGVFCSFGAFLLYNWAQSQIKASSAAVSINMVPVVALILGWVFLGESLNKAQMISSLLVIGGVLLSQMEFRKERPELIPLDKGSSKERLDA